MTETAEARRPRSGWHRGAGRRPASARRALVRTALTALLAAASITGCGRTDSGITLRFWAMGREGEVVQELVTDFERENPGVKVIVQQIPWSAAHEKLLTSHVGGSLPDLGQLGNTWIAEFSALKALEPLDPRLTPDGVHAEAYFPGIWDTNVMGGRPYGIPWYVDTRLLFYRRDLLREAGYDSMPGTWTEWREAMIGLKKVAGGDRFAIILPLNEWTHPVIFGLQAGSPLLTDHGTRGAFSEPPFQRAFRFYLDLYRDGLAPPVTSNEISNIYQEFARGYFSMYITGPWNIGEFKTRIPAELQDAWATAPLPGPDGAESGVSLAGGSSLVLYRSSKNKDAAWKLIEFLSRPEQQVRFYTLTGDLPARVESWRDPLFADDEHVAAFGRQLERAVSTPKVPEWELIATRVQEWTERAVRGAVHPDSAMAGLDREVGRILEKRRWLLEHDRLAALEAGTP